MSVGKDPGEMKRYLRYALFAVPVLLVAVAVATKIATKIGTKILATRMYEEITTKIA